MRDLFYQVDLRSEDLLFLCSVDNSHAIFKGDRRLFVTRFTALEQFEILFKRAYLVELVLHKYQDLHVAAEDILFVVEVDRLSQEDAPARLDPAKLTRLKEAFLARGAQEAHDHLTDLVLLETHCLRLA